jgi:homoserine kinase
LIRFTDQVVRIEVPATSANLGPGFDSFGLALSRYDEVSAQVIAAGLEFEFVGEGAHYLPQDERHLISRAMRATFDVLGAQPSGLRITSINRIPHGRGLGSSAAAIVAGVMLARALVADGSDRLSEPDVLALASAIEGHPDNVAACLLGGLTVAWTAAGRAAARGLTPSGVHPAVFIPQGESSTVTARAALPELVPHADAAFNAARAAMLLLALTGHPDLLLDATEDRLHQHYRAAGMPDSTALLDGLRTAGLAAVISGAGSSVLALLTGPDEIALAGSMAPSGWEFARLEVAAGARLLTARR